MNERGRKGGRERKKGRKKSEERNKGGEEEGVDALDIESESLG